jgi:hypothetical protein
MVQKNPTLQREMATKTTKKNFDFYEIELGKELD